MRTLLLLGVIMLAVSFGAQALTGSGDSAITPLETVSPSLQVVSAVTERSLSATFSESMRTPGVTTPGNYAASGAGVGTLTTSPSTVSGAGPYTLSWSAGEMQDGASVTVTATGVQDLVGNPINPAHDSGSCVGLGIAPVFTNLVANPAQASAGEAVTITFTCSETLDGYPEVSINGHTAARVSGGKSVNYIYSYVVQTGDPLGMANVEVTGFDLAGNLGSLGSDTALNIVDEQVGLPLHAWPAGLVLLVTGVLLLAKRRRLGMALLVLALLASSGAFAASPSVTNVTLSQSPNGATTKVDIYYDLVAPNGPCTISAALSKDGGADGYMYPITHCTGDIAGVISGTGKHIVWDIRADYPEENIPNARIRLTASSLASVTYNLGTSANYTTIQRGPDTLSWLKKGTLSTGSILRSVIANATLEMKIQEDHDASNICLFVDPTPEDRFPGPGALQVGGYWPSGDVVLPLNNYYSGSHIGATASDTKVYTDWLSLGDIDLVDHQVSIGNMFNLAAGWSGAMTILYDGPGNDIVTFSLPGYPGVITSSPGGNTIAVVLPYGTPLTNLAPTFTMCDGATCKNKADNTPIISGVTPIDFTVPVVYSVTAQDGVTTKDYTVTITAPASTACDIENFNPNLAGSRAKIMSAGANSGMVVVNVPAGTTEAQLAVLTPTLTLSPEAACVIPTPPLSLTAPVHYIVTAQDGVTTRDYTVTVATDAEDFRLFVVKTTPAGLTDADYDYLSLVPVSRHANKGIPAIFTIANESDFSTNIYLRDYLRRYRPSTIHTVNFNAAISDFTTAAVNAAGPLELSAVMATSYWPSSAKVVLVSDAVEATNYSNVLQAAALAAALDAPMLYYNAAQEALVQDAITQLGATEVVYVNAAGTRPALADLVLTCPAMIVNYLSDKGITVDYFAATNPQDLNLIMGSKMSLTAPFLAARRNGIVVPIATYIPNINELFHYTGYPAISAELRKLYQDIGRYPGYLALVGSPTSIPLSYTAGINQLPIQILNSPTDRDYANADDDPFPDIAIGRIMAFNIFDGTLYTCRISTYEQLFDGDWENSYTTRTRAPAFDNYGYLYKEARMEDAALGKPFNAAYFGHGEHSSQGVLGGFFDTNSTNILAPMLITSGGCAVAGIDFETIVDEYNSPTTNTAGEFIVANTLVRLGAVAFMGCTRLADAWTEQIFGVFGVEALKGEPLGRCYQKAAAQNIMGLDYWFMDQGRKPMLLGDPAFRLHVPSAPLFPPANHVVANENASQDLLTLTAIPYTDYFRTEVGDSNIREWGQTPPLYSVSMPGLFGDGGGAYVYTAKLTTDKAVSSVTQLSSVPAGFGGVNAYSVDYHQDGTQDVMWYVVMHDWDWKAGVVNNQVTNIQYRIAYDMVPDLTSFEIDLAGSNLFIQSQSDTSGTVTVYVPAGVADAEIAALAPSYTLDFSATCNQPNNAVPTPPLSVGAPVSYIVSPGAGSSSLPKVYLVSVVRSPFTYVPWTGDADSGISNAYTYTAAVNIGGAAVTVNGVDFEAQSPNYPWSGANFLIEGATSGFSGGAPNLTGNSLTLGSDFQYDNPPYSVTLTNLAPGKSYETTFFSYGFGNVGRTQTFASGSDARPIDQNAYGNGNGIRIVYRFVADSTTKIITITPTAGANGTFHLCALANRML